MAEVPTFHIAKSAYVYKTKLGRPKKYEDSWRTMNKRVYILQTMLVKLR